MPVQDEDVAKLNWDVEVEVEVGVEVEQVGFTTPLKQAEVAL